MFKQTYPKFAATLAIFAAIAMTTGCGENVLGPERSPAVLGEKQRPPEITPIELAPPGADLNGDGMVDASDIAAFAATMAADMNGDRIVGQQDLELLQAVMNGEPVDQNGDGYVDASDIAAFSYAAARADLTGDGKVDASDIGAFAVKRSLGDVNRDDQVSKADLEVIRSHLGEEIEPVVVLRD